MDVLKILLNPQLALAVVGAVAITAAVSFGVGWSQKGESLEKARLRGVVQATAEFKTNKAAAESRSAYETCRHLATSEPEACDEIAH